jgi:hypothetical protein
VTGPTGRLAVGGSQIRSMNMAHCPNPLNHQDCAVLKACQASCVETRELVNACKECGIPVEESEAQNNMQLDFATNVLKKFFPHNDV